MNKNVNKCLSDSEERRISEFLVRCDEAISVITDDDSIKIPEDFIEVSSKQKSELAIAQYIHPDDIEQFRETINSCSFLRVTHCRVRVIFNGTEKQYDCRGIKYPNLGGMDRERIVKLAFDTAVEQDESVIRCHRMMESMIAAVWEYNLGTDTIRYTPVSAQTEVFTLRGKAFIDLLEDTLILHPDFRTPYRKLRNAFNSGTGDINMEVKLYDTSNDYRWYTIAGSPVTDESGKVTGYIGHLRNTDSFGGFNTTVKTDDDQLTGLLNRHGMERCAGRALASGTAESSALIIFDVDGFNKITNQVGKHFSDALLVDIGGVLHKAFDSADLVCRVSKDIFAVLLLNPQSADAVSKKLSLVKQAFRNIYLNSGSGESVTCCIGISIDEAGKMTYEQLYYQADTALAYAKSLGMDHTVIFEDNLDYIISDKITERKIAHSQEVTSEKSFDLISQAIDVLFESRELRSSINIVLSLIGHRYNLTKAEILEFTDDYQEVYSTYRWNPDYQSLNNPNKREVATIEEMILLDYNAEYYICRNVAALEENHPAVAAYLKSFGINSFIQIPIRDGERISGVISFGFENDIVVTRSEAVRELALISKIVAGYITRLQSKLDFNRLSSTDTLTGCYNFTRFVTEARHIIQDNPNTKHLIVYSDIDRFKVINETFGYLVGDKVLIEFSRIIAERLNPGELIGRIDADKFVMLLKCKGQENLLERFREVDKKINEMSVFNGTSYKVPLRCGICGFSSNEDVTSVIDKANLARKNIKNTHVSTYTFFDDEMKSRIIQQKEIENVMFDALKNGEFVVYLQPKFSLSCNHITGAEALVRWNRPGFGLLSPIEFIPIFEENGFIIELDFYVMDRVCAKLRSDIDRGYCPYPISVNFSRVHLKKADFIDRIKEVLERYDLPKQLIEVEITESALVGNEDYLVNIMSELHRLGLIVSMDDFGSGYSTLNMLKKFPVDVLKIDKDFFAESGSSERERLIIASVVNMAKSLNIRVVSEGVETAEQANFLRDVNCDIAQGYLYARPMKISDYESEYQSASEA